jgi:anhydro-N-acetylmuramic acid kinase
MSINNLVNKKTKKILGLMSGTSCDGLDMALIELIGYGLKTSYKLIGSGHHKYNESVKQMLFGIMTPGTADIRELSQVNFYLAKIWAKAIKKFLKDHKLSSKDIDLIGSHGHTIYHHPQLESVLDQKIRSTWQIGDPSVIAQLTGISTVGDFRVADVALGGQGAPLVPYFDWLSFAHRKENIIALNIGGIANLTYVPKDSDPSGVIAFDTGPGNMLIDQLMLRLYEKPIDKDGKIACAGRFSERLFNYLLKIDDYLEMSPPKSTGREHYNEKFIIDLLKKAVRWRIREPDIIHTVSKYTAYAVWQAYEKYINSDVRKIFVGGGGSHNKFIMNMLSEYFEGVPVQNVRDAGIDEDYKEAICFAVLANECVHGVATGMPNVTGAQRSAVLGKICQV